MTNSGTIAIGSLDPPSPPSGIANSGEIEIYSIAAPSIYTDTFESTEQGYLLVEKHNSVT